MANRTNIANLFLAKWDFFDYKSVLELKGITAIVTGTSRR
jgi:hypothetical protein